MGCQGWGNRLYIGISGELEALLGPGFLPEVDTYGMGLILGTSIF